MPDADNIEGSQLAHATNELNYGHLGTAKYQEKGREWSFLRVFAENRKSQSAFPFNAIERKTVHESSTSFGAPCWSGGISSSSAGHNGPSYASANINEEEKLSSAIIDSLDRYDPRLSDRLAFGGASLVRDTNIRSSYATIPIATLASGVNGEDIILTQVGRESVTVTDEDDNDLVVGIPTIAVSKRTVWTGNGESVQQICFAATTGYGSTWMAARLLSSTAIFHPLFHEKPIAETMLSNTMSSGEASVLDANHVLTIPISRTGGHPHADVSFHSVDCHLLALVDQHGNWSTWRVDSKRLFTTGTVVKIELLRVGKIYTWENLKRPFTADPYHDGWHKICWIADDDGSSEAIFVANRRKAFVQGSLDDEKHSVNLAPAIASQAQWILDVKRSALHSGWVFVLTSTRVLCISTANSNGKIMPMTGPHKALCSWQHFRNRNDITLSLAILETPQSTVILLWSRINVLVHAYRVNTPSELPAAPLTWVEPCLLNLNDLNAMPEVHNIKTGPLTVLVRPVQVERPPEATDELLKFLLHKIFILQADHSVSEILLQNTPELTASEDHKKSNAIPLPPKSDSVNKSSKYVDLEALDDFLLQDTKEIPKIQDDRNSEQLRSNQVMIEPWLDSAIDWREVYELMFEGPTTEPTTKRVSFEEHLQATRSRLQRAARTRPGVRLLSEVLTPLPLVAEVESSSASLVSLTEGSTPSAQVAPVFYSLPTRLQSNNALEHYQTLVSNWLTPLPLRLPDRIRVVKERLARQVAADLALAGIAVRPSSHGLEPLAARNKSYPNSGPQATVISTSSLDRDPSSPVAHSQPTSPFPLAVEEHPACLRLRTYTTVSSNAVTTALPAVVSGILAHLPSDPEIDPSAYNWQASEASITTASHEEDASAAGVRERRQAEKLARAKQKRIESQTETAKQLEQLRVPPAVGSSRQMVLPTREVQSSQIKAPESNVLGADQPMTQPERGAFGTRLGGLHGAGRKNKDKKRVAGF